MDDGSTDASGDLCDEFAAKDPRVKVIHQKNRGLWAARNTGQEISTGSYLMFPDGDISSAIEPILLEKDRDALVSGLLRGGDDRFLLLAWVVAILLTR